MNWNDWYTDTMSIYRTQEVMDGSLTRHERALVSENIPCRIYQSDNRTINMTETASNVDQSDHLACDISVDVRAGDEIIVKRGGRLGRQGPTIRLSPGTPTSTMNRSGPSSQVWPTRKFGCCSRSV